MAQLEISRSSRGLGLFEDRPLAFHVVEGPVVRELRALPVLGAVDEDLDFSA